MNKSGEAGFASLKKGKRHDPLRGVGPVEEHRKAVNEIANGGLNAAAIGFCGQMPLFDVQLVTEKGKFFSLRFQVGRSGICEHEIQNSKAALNVFESMPAAVEVLAADL